MASIWRRTMVYLGLVDDDEYEEYEPYDEPPPQPPTQPAPLRRGARSAAEPLDSGYEPESTGVRTLPRDDYPTADPRGMDARYDARGGDQRASDTRSMGGGMSGTGMGGSGMGSSGAVTVQPRPSVVRPFTQPQAAKVHVTVPVGFNDAQEIGDKLKANQPVI